MPASRTSQFALVIANLVPLAGVIWFDWRVFDVLILYWVENVVIGIINVLRMLACRGGLTGIRAVDSGGRLFLIPFFAVHYGFFCFGHYTAVVSFFDDPASGASAGMPALLWESGLWVGVAAIAISHLVSFGFNFIGRGEYLRTSLTELMHRPYGRIVVMHLTVIGGAFLMAMFGNPLWMLVLLIALKVGFDLGLHRRERSVFDRAMPAGG